MNSPHWRVVHIYDPRNVWDFPSDSEPVSEPVEIYLGQFELVVDLPPLENSEYHRSKAHPAPVLDDNVTCLVETNEDINDDDDNNDAQADYHDDEEEAKFDDDTSDDIGNTDTSGND